MFGNWADASLHLTLAGALHAKWIAFFDSSFLPTKIVFLFLFSLIGCAKASRRARLQIGRSVRRRLQGGAGQSRVRVRHGY